MFRYLTVFKVCAFLYRPAFCCVYSKLLSLCQCHRTA